MIRPMTTPPLAIRCIELAERRGIYIPIESRCQCLFSGERNRALMAGMKQIDHIILNVNDLEGTISFYTEVLGFTNEGQDGPFAVLRVSDDFTLQVAPWGTQGNEHYAFALER